MKSENSEYYVETGPYQSLGRVQGKNVTNLSTRMLSVPPMNNKYGTSPYM